MSTHRQLHHHGRNELVDSAVKELRARGIPVTEQRVQIIRALAEEPDYLSADQLLKSVPGAHRATVYRTLELLAEVGLAQTKPEGNAAAYHLLGTDEGSHIHLHCSGCGRIHVAPANCCTGPECFIVDWHQSHLVGLCRDCATRV